MGDDDMDDDALLAELGGDEDPEEVTARLEEEIKEETQ